MVTKSETAIVRTLMKHIKSLGGDSYHVHGSQFQRTGEPDISGELPLYMGHKMHLKIEVKTATGKASPLQLYRLKSYRAYGYIAGVVTSVDEFDKLVKEHKRGIKPD